MDFTNEFLIDHQLIALKRTETTWIISQTTQTLPSGYDIHSLPWYRWPIYRWFSQLDTSIHKGFSMAMLNNQACLSLVKTIYFD